MPKRPPSFQMQPVLLERFPGPLHRRLYLALRAQILRGDFRRGDRLPSSRAFAKALGISRNTVLGAYDKLADEELVLARVGSGTRVVKTFPHLLVTAARAKAGIAGGSRLAEILERSHYPARTAPFHDRDGNALYLYDPRPPQLAAYATKNN